LLEEFSTPPQPYVHLLYPSTVSPRFDFGLIIEDAMRLLKNGVRQFATIFLAIQVPLVLVQMLALPAPDQPQGDLGSMGNMILAAIFFGFLGIFATLNVMTAARHHVVGAPKPFYEVFLNAMVRFPTAVFTALVLGIVVFTGLLALIIPGIVFYVFGCCSLQAIALTDRRIFASLIESYELVRGHWWQVFALQFMLFATLLVISLPLILVDTFLTPPLLVKIPIYLFINALEIVITLVNVMMFYNLLAIKAHRAAGL
jgi:hypothetical protein